MGDTFHRVFQRIGHKFPPSIFASILLLSLPLPSSASQKTATTYPKPKPLIGSNYFPAVHEALTQAQESIDIVMYFIIMDQKGLTNPVNTLVGDLIAAGKRNVKVRVILENEKGKENRLAFKTLRKSGIAVYYDSPKTFLHSKAVVIDSRISILGSATEPLLVP